MFKTIKIKGFRGFSNFEITNLGRLNLLVGNNNSGKTSILEAIQMLCAQSNFEALSEAMERRGEIIWNDYTTAKELDVRHLFYGHALDSNSQISITGIHQNQEEKLVVLINKSSIPSPGLETPTEEDSNRFLEQALFLEMAWGNPALQIHPYKNKVGDRTAGARRELSRNGGLPLETRHVSQSIHPSTEKNIKTQFVTSSSLTSIKMVELFEDIVLKPEESIIQESIKKISPNIERIASVRSEKSISSNTKAGFVVRLSNSDQRVPIGSFGDGTWRMLGLALATTSVSNGVLLIDEIDTGLHYSVMTDMWQLIWETAKRLNVQIFATTHNSDCWSSLANLVEEKDSQKDKISIQRIEKGKSSSVAFTEQEIAIAAKRGIEVR